jgi:hypothetical protein
MDLNDWLGAQAEEFRERGDPEPLRMLQCYVEGFRAREKDPDASWNAFREGRQIAEGLREPWWVLYFAKMCIDARMHFKRDFRDILDDAVACVLEVRKSTNAQYPGRHGVWDSLVAAYLGIDALGHADSIRDALQYLETEISEEPGGERYLLLARQRIFALECGQLKDAYDVAMRELKLASGDPTGSRAVHFGTFAFCALCQIAGTVGDWPTLGEWSNTAEALAREVGHQCELAEALAWQAVAALQAGQGEQARRTQQTAVSHMGRLGMPPKQGYFQALATFHEMIDDLPGALAVREAELASVLDRGRLLYEARTHIQRCALLARLGQLRPEDLDAARQATGRLRKPESLLVQIEQLASQG